MKNIQFSFELIVKYVLFIIKTKYQKVVAKPYDFTKF